MCILVDGILALDVVVTCAEMSPSRFPSDAVEWMMSCNVRRCLNLLDTVIIIHIC